MRLISVNAGLPRDMTWRGKVVRTSIWKSPLTGRVRVTKLNLEGDRQSDLSVHGGADKAVYAYPSEHYTYWRRELGVAHLAWGSFGENFTTEGLLEEQVRIGDRLRVGSTEFVVTQPRMPCFKLGIRFDRPQIVKQFLQSGRTGFYLSVLHEGEVVAGDPIEWMDRAERALTVAELVSLYAEESGNREMLRRAAELPALPAAWKDYFRKRL